MTNKITLHHGDCLEVLRAMPDSSVDSIVTDPPYGLSFMGKKWDYDVPATEVWAECLRVLKPGGHLLAFAGTRTQHRMAVRIEDAGFEIRDMIAWVYGSGFPKSLDVSKAIDKAAGRIGQSVIDLKQHLIALADASGMTRSAIDVACGFRATNYLTLPADGKKPDPWVNCLPPREKWAIMKRVLGADDSLDEVFTHAEREVVGVRQVVPGVAFSSDGPTELEVTAPATEAARQWQGWGTALKPALEPITVARKPLSEGTVAANVLQHGTGALNIDGCRVATNGEITGGSGAPKNGTNALGDFAGNGGNTTPDSGRWPANLIHSGEPEVLACFPDSNGSGPARTLKRGQRANGDSWGMQDEAGALRDAGTGSAARFFKQVSHDDEDLATAQRFMYCAKASKRDRGEGNTHPTVKPTDLMAYLCRLVTPPGGVVLDPFMGSGSTGKAAMREGFRFVGIEREAQYMDIARARIHGAIVTPAPDLFSMVREAA